MLTLSSLVVRFWSFNGVAGALAAEVGHDPGRIRLLNAVRAVGASLVSAIILYQFTIQFKHPIALAAPGFLISFLWVLLARENTFLGQIEMLLASSAIISATLIISPLLSNFQLSFGAIYLCAGIFIGILLQDCMRRALGITVIWFVATCVELYLSPPITAIPFQIASVAIGAMSTLAICILFFPHSPIRILQSALLDFQWNSNLIRHSALNGSSRVDVRKKANQRACGRMSRSIAVIENELRGHRSPQSDSLFHALTRAHAACCYLANPEAQILPPTCNSAIHDNGSAEWLRGRMSARIALLDESISTLRIIAEKIEIRPTALTAKKPISIKSLAWRPAIQITSAVTAALLLAEFLVPGRWYWAVVTANAVLARSNTATLHRSFLRLVGTVAGLVIGLVAGWIIGGNLMLTCAAMFVVIFALHFYIPANYGIGVLFATIFVGLLYASLGFSETQILLTRLEETGIGVLAAIFVSIALFPTKTVSEASLTERGVLIALIEAVDTLANDSKESLSNTYQQFRVLDQKLIEAELALRPVITLEGLIGRRTTYERWICLEDCCSWLKIALHDLDLDSSKPAETPTHFRSLASMLKGIVDGTYVLRDGWGQPLPYRDTNEDATARVAAALNRYWAANHRQS
ncbi:MULTISPECIES: FUSC family protein [unclassified Burkholderia]|uniref:FUSC family protein n=1 Tax=unclassified Burkholderia TaxID=2613784 RepID=UPI0021503162|nr:MULTISPECIES: FUSC family protein [unclassified Burkholderia]MCR4471797.1 FUSC family protein [Burkholderia sp. SCN-KJ]